MIHKKISAVVFALALLLIVYSIAAAMNLQDQVQLQLADNASPQVVPGDGTFSVGSFTGYVSPVIDNSAGAQKPAGNPVGQANFSDEILAGSMEDTLSPAWLVGWIIQGVGALALITLLILGTFWLVQNRRRVS